MTIFLFSPIVTVLNMILRYLVQVFNTCGFLGNDLHYLKFLQKTFTRVGSYISKNSRVEFSYQCYSGHYYVVIIIIKNLISYVIIILSSLNLSVCVCLQEHSHFFIHLVASIIYCYGSMVYFWIQLFLIYWAEPSRDKRFTGPALAVCCIAQTIAGNLSILLL